MLPKTRLSNRIRIATVLAVLPLATALAPVTARAGWSAGIGVENFDWREHTSPIEVHEHGPRFSSVLSFSQSKEHGLLLGGRGEVYGGPVDYDGSFQFDATTAASGTATYFGFILGGETRWRWPSTADVVAGVEYESWRRHLSANQEETYRTVSLRLGLEHRALEPGEILAGGGVRFLLATGLDATIEDSGVKYALGLEPGRGSNPFLHAGVRATPHVTVLVFWDGMNLGPSNQVELRKRGEPVAVVRQPETDVSRVGVRVVYGW